MRFHRDVTAMLLIKITVLLIVVRNALGFVTGCGNVILFSFDLSVFCGSFRVESKTTIKIYISPDVLFMNEAYKVLEINRFFFK